MSNDWQAQAVKLYERAMAVGDPRVRDWPMMNPFHTLALIAVYLLTVRVLMWHTKRHGGYGVTEAAMGCPIRASMETVIVCQFQIVGIDAGELVEVEPGRPPVDIPDVEPLRRLRHREECVVAMAPTQAREITE